MIKSVTEKLAQTVVSLLIGQQIEPARHLRHCHFLRRIWRRTHGKDRND